MDPREIERDRNRKLLHELDARHRELHQRSSDDNVRFRQIQAETRQGLDQTQQQNAAAQAEFARLTQELGSVRQGVDAFRGATQSGYADIQQDLAGLQRSVASTADLTRLRSELGTATNEFQRIRSAVQQEQAKVKSDMDTLRRAKKELQREVSAMTKEAQAAMREIQNSKKTDSEQHRKIQEQERQLATLKDNSKVKGELQSTKRQGDQLATEFRKLMAQLQERGVLTPVREAPPEEEEEIPPVGTIELGEDCFTARLLLRLGFMKAKGAREMSMASMDSYDEEVSSDPGINTENVAGLQEPEVVEGGPGYFQVTTGWLGICVITLLLQFLVILVMLKNGAETGDDCLEKEPSFSEWFLLHVSKACAMCVAGILLGKDLMDVLNYWMVSELLEPRRSIEVIISAVLRGSLTVLIAAATVVIYMGLSSPASVWINMTAVSFIGELGGSMLEVAKRGVFGHHISKAMTTLNFQLTFISEYPAWFPWARRITVIACFGGILFFCTVVFVMPDNLCKA